MKTRTTVNAVIKDRSGKFLLCRKPKNLGVYADTWAIPGGGIEEGETMFEALEREVKEEVGLELIEVEELMFADDTAVKTYRDGSSERVYMIYLIFVGVAKNPEELELNDEFVEFGWFDLNEMFGMNLNDATRRTFQEVKRRNI